jgi:hypothetical protein
MAQENATDDRGTGFQTRAGLLKALRGKGWTKAEFIDASDREEMGFEIGGFSYQNHGTRFHKIGSWTTGAGDGWSLYRKNIDGQTVDFAVTKDWPHVVGDAVIAVHGDDGRDARRDEVSDYHWDVQEALDN